MQENPFATMIETIANVSKEQLPVNFRFGYVKSVNPLRIDVAGTIQESTEVLKNSLITEFSEADMLLLVPIEEEQRYIILCKVVSV